LAGSQANGLIQYSDFRSKSPVIIPILGACDHPKGAEHSY
jgi:hypothetical protein